MSNEHFQIIDETISPQPWTQYRLLASRTTASVSRSYDTSGGGNKNDPVHTVSLAWTNDTPVPQYVYGMVTRGGAQVALQARSRGYLAMSHGIEITPTPDPPGSFDMIEVSRFGGGMDVGRGGLLAIGTGFGVHEVRANSASAPLVPQRTGWPAVAPGETFHARVELRFISEFWENTMIDGGDQNTVSQFISGDTRLDLYGIPAVIPPSPRPTPTIVGVEHGVNNTFPADVDVPAGTQEGDIILAIVANNIGLASDITPQEPGWTQVHVRNDGLAGIGDVHMKVYMRTATDDEPASYRFTTGILAEVIAHLVVIRDASPFLTDGWQFASSLRRFFWERAEGHICPSIDRAGQLLLCASYFAHSPLQAPINQEPPDGMTELSDVDANGSSCAVAAMPNPPRPTGERMFVPTKTPQWSGRSIALTILVPGAPTL